MNKVTCDIEWKRRTKMTDWQREIVAEYFESDLNCVDFAEKIDCSFIILKCWIAEYLKKEQK